MESFLHSNPLPAASIMSLDGNRDREDNGKTERTEIWNLSPQPVLCCGCSHAFWGPTENMKRGKRRWRSIPCYCPRLWPHPWWALSQLGVILSSFVLNQKDSFCLGWWFPNLFQKAPFQRESFGDPMYKCEASLAEMVECFGSERQVNVIKWISSDQLFHYKWIIYSFF